MMVTNRRIHAGYNLFIKRKDLLILYEKITCHSPKGTPLKDGARVSLFVLETLRYTCPAAGAGRSG